MNQCQEVQIAAYSLGYFPETKEDADAIGMKRVAEQMEVVCGIIANAFKEVFGEPISNEKFNKIKREKTYDDNDDWETLFFDGKPFMEIGEMTDEFKDIDGVKHMVINQQYRVLA